MGVRWDNPKGIEALYDDTDESIDLFVVRAADRVADRLHELVTDLTPMSDDPFREFPGRLPGTLKRSWEKGEVEMFRDGRVRVTVETFDPVAPHVEWDTSPHLIRARRAAALRFYSPLGELVFAKVVNHPGTTGQHMMARALDRLQAELPAILRQEMFEWARGQAA